MLKAKIKLGLSFTILSNTFSALYSLTTSAKKVNMSEKIFQVTEPSWSHRLMTVNFS